MRKLLLPLAVICLIPALVVADECTDACDSQLGSSLSDCQAFYDFWMNQCNQDYFLATDQCQSDLDSCLEECNGDPECESNCYATFDQCNQFAADENSSCLGLGESDFQDCVSNASANHEECVEACNPVPVEGSSWGSLKARYK